MYIIIIGSKMLTDSLSHSLKKMAMIFVYLIGIWIKGII
jgi:hypothetical protein